MYILIAKIVRAYNEFLKRILKYSYTFLWKIYRTGKMNELTFDHEIDVFLRWPEAGQFQWGCIAAFNLWAINSFKTPSVLELGCSDGFYPFYFYRHIEKCRYLGVDLDKDNLKIANQRLKGTNCSVMYADFLRHMPIGDFSNIIWCESINMFTPIEQEEILGQIAKRLMKYNGILSGTGVLKKIGRQWKYYTYLFNSADELRGILNKYFTNVFVYTRDNMPDNAVFFMASNGGLPLDDNANGENGKMIRQ